tara:strand:- start:273 stop:461 length:189 start_codon:yes stop_codon:yes gene_type:complete
MKYVIIEYKTRSGEWRHAGTSGDMTDQDIKIRLESALRNYGDHGGAVRAVTKDGQMVDMLTK